MKQCEARVKKFIYSELSHHIILSFAFFAAIPVEKPFCMAHHAHELSRLYRWSLSRSHHIASRNNVPLPPSVDATFPLSILLVFFFLTSSTLAIHTLQWREALGILGKMSTSAERTRLLLSKSFCEGHSSIYYQGRGGGRGS